MALIKCKECGKEVSDKAAKCIHCGAPIEVEVRKICPDCNKEYDGKKCNNCGYSDSNKQDESVTNKANKGNVIRIISGLAGLGVSIWIFVSIFMPPGALGGTYVNRDTGAKIILKSNSGKFVMDGKTENITSLERYKDGGINYIDLKFSDGSKWSCTNMYDYIRCNGYYFNKE